MAVPEGVLSWLWVAASCVVVPAWAGRAVLSALGLSTAPGASVLWGYGYVVGQGLAAVLTALWLWSGQAVPGLVIPLALLAVACCRRRRPAAAPARLTPWLRVAVAFVVVAFLVACLRTNVLPIHQGDEGEQWTAKAKVLYGMPMGALAAGLPWVGHPDYPCLNPLLQVSAFAASGRVLHAESRLPLQAFGIAVVLLLAGGVAARTRQWAAIAAVVACAATLGTCAATSAYADALVACTLLAAVDALVRWRDEGDPAWWRIACLAAGTMLASKNEGVMWVALIFVCAGATSWSWLRQRRPLRGRDLAWLLVPIAVVLAGQVFNAVHGLHTDLVNADAEGKGPLGRLLDQFVERGPVVLGAFGRMLVDPSEHRLLPALCIAAGLVAALAGGRRFLQSPAALVVGCVVGGLIGYMSVLVSSPSDLGWQLSVAGARIVEHLVPLAAYGCCLTIAPAEGSIPPHLRGRPAG